VLLLASLAGGAEAAWRDGGPILHRVRSIDGLAGTSGEREIHALRRQKAARTAPERKIDSHLARTAGAVEGAVPVHVRLGSITAQDLAELGRAGLRVLHVDRARQVVTGRMATRDAAAIAALPFVTAIRPLERGRPRVGAATTEGDADAKADQVRLAGYDGSGTIVGVISDGIDSLASAQATGDLPEVAVPSDARCGAGHGDEGTALLEIVHDLAPGARLLFSQGIDSSVGFIESVDCLVAAGANVIVDDVGFFDEPFFEDGPVAAAVRRAVQAGVSYHSAAGNEADSYLEQTYRASSSDDLHDFLGGPEDTTDDMLIGPFDSLVCFLQWDDPFGAAADDYDLFMLDGSSHVIDAGTSSQTGTQDPIEFVAAQNGSSAAMPVKIVIQKYSGAVRRLKMFCLGGLQQEYVSPSGSVFGQAALPEAIAVGAIDIADPGLGDVEFFSSRGPTTIAFPAPETRPKPDLAAFDGVSITNAGGFPLCPPACRFFGTSAAAPHSAAVAALLLGKNPFLSPATIQNVLREAAADIGLAGPDDVSGFGRLDALAAAEAVPTPECRTDRDCDDGDACTSDACDRGACAHSPVLCSAASRELCTESVCDRTQGCLTPPLGGLVGVACWLDSMTVALEAATPLDAAPRVRHRLVRLVASSDAAVRHAQQAEEAGKLRRERARLRAAGRRLETLAHATRAAERRARVTFRLADILRSRLGRARALFAGLRSRP